MKKILAAVLLMIASAGECAWIQGAIPKSQINKSSTTTTTDTSSKKTSTTSTSSGKSTTSTSSTTSRATGTIIGHEYVDLGLSVKWATCNVGASSPEDYGDFYAWGETITKSSYGDGNCATWEKEIGDIGGTSRDVAHVKWGSPWRMPTEAEFDELCNPDNCTWEWTSQGGHKGYKVTSKKNGNSIFLPAAGWCYGSSLHNRGEYGFYWSSTPNGSNTQGAYDLDFFSRYYNTYWDYRSTGHPVRPVSEFMIASAGECAWTQEAIPKSQINKSSTTTTTDTSSKKTSTTSTSSGKSTTSTSSTTLRATGTIAGHEYVDLGLSVKWATCNVGASSPEEYGDYYAWGETITKSSYYEENCETWKKEIGDIGGTSRDVARVKWGSPWRMPTRAEFDELRDSDNCTWTWIIQGGHKGYKVTSRKNGNSIFLPAAGSYCGTWLLSTNAWGDYWSSTLYEGSTRSAYYLVFYSSDHDTDSSYRNFGHTVRPVAESGYESRKSSVTISEGQETRLEGSLSRQTTVAAASSSGGSSSSGASGTHNGYGYVDLGLPSGLKWATCNVGADNPEDYGDYYAWGETKTKLSYNYANCKTYGKSIGDIKGTSRDVAHVKWGGSWRMPTKAEFDELLDSDNCTWTWTTQGGHNGYKVTSKKNGNSIFLPAAGWRSETSLYRTDSWGDYWSSTPDEGDTQYACSLDFGSSGRGTRWGYRRGGYTVRPVAEF